MTIVLKEFLSLSQGAVPLGTPFEVQYRIVGKPNESGTIVVSCIDQNYSAGPNIPVSLGSGETGKVDGASVTINGPPGAATVMVKGVLVETHLFPQDVL